MTKWLIAIMVLGVIGGFSASDAYAAAACPSPLPVYTIIECADNSSTPSHLISPLVKCLANIPVDGTGTFDCSGASGQLGIIPGNALKLLTNTVLQTYFLNIANAMVLLVVLFFGYSILMGNIERPKAETFKLIFKVAGVAYFLNNAPGIYGILMSALNELAGDVSNISTTVSTTTGLVSGGGFCNPTTATPLPNPMPTGTDALWWRWDCIFDTIFFFSGGKLLGGAIAGFLFLLLGAATVGILIFMMAIYLVISVFFGVARFIHIYLMAVISFSFLYCLGYLFVPLLLFKRTYEDYFVRWLNICIGYLLTPIIMFAYMGMMLTTLDMVMFSGNYSIWNSIVYQSPSAPKKYPSYAAAGANAFNDVVSKVNPVQQFIHLFYLDFSSIMSVDSNNTAATDPSQPPLDAGELGGKKDKYGNVISPLHHVYGTNGIAMTGSAYDANPPGTVANIGFNIPALNISALAAPYCTPIPPSTIVCQACQKGTPAQSPSDCQACSACQSKYISGILTAFGAATLIAYVMFSLLSYIPTLAGSLASQGTDSSMEALSKSEVFAEAAVRNTVDMVKEAAIGFVTQGGAAGAAKGAALSAAKSVAKNASKDMATQRDKK